MSASAWLESPGRIARLCVPAMLMFLAAAEARAQSPVITPAGDPTVRADSIYALVVDSTKHRQESYVWLLDDGVVRAEADGTGSTTYRQIIQILQPEAVEDWAERSLSWDPEKEEVTLNWARVLDLNGKVISEKPVHVQVGDAPVPEQSPVYTKRKIMRLSLGGVAPGTIIDYSTTHRTKVPILRGNFYASWLINSGSTVRRSRYIVDLPEGVPFHVRERSLQFKPVEQHMKGRVIRNWSRSDLEWREAELFASDSNDVVQRITLAGPIGWADIASWYAGLAKGRMASTPALDAKLAEITRGAATRLDSLRAVHRWIAQDVRYVSISLGVGGYQPRLPEEVMKTAVGDCKDKATLFVTLARRLGFDAYPVLVSSNGEAERDMPGTAEFDHMIAAVHLSPTDTSWKFLDLTSSLSPFDEVPPGVHGEFGLLVRDDGTPVEITFPKLKPEENRSEGLLVGSVDEKGHFSGSLTRTGTGLLQYKLRDTFSQSLTDRQKQSLLDAVAGSVVEGARGDSLEAFDGRDLRASVRVKLRIAGDGALRRASQGWVFMLPLARYASPDLVAKLENEKTRQFPFEASGVIGPIERIDTLRLTIPAGWVVDLPTGVTAESAFGTYHSSYAQNGREVVVERRMRGSEGVLPPSSKAELISWLNKVGEDDATFLLLHPATAGAPDLTAAGGQKPAATQRKAAPGR